MGVFHEGHLIMLRACRTAVGEDLIPQAIVWRPIRYFSTYVRTDQDDLDTFEVASFDVGNDYRFDLRHYGGHPPLTVTIYLPQFIEDLRIINSALDYVLKELTVPAKAVAWRRGQPFEYGVLHRSTDDRLREQEARVVALKIAARRLNRTVTTEHIKRELPKIFPLSAIDLNWSPSRRNERLWQQIVGNVISHGRGPKGIFALGLAERTQDGLKITETGLDYLKSIGFSG